MTEITNFEEELNNQVEENQALESNQALDLIDTQTYLEVGERPWGKYYVLEDQANFKVKKIIVKPDSRLSLQKHKHRAEHWIVVSGTATVENYKMGDSEKLMFEMHSNESCFIPMGNIHRLSNNGKIDLILIEVQTGEYTGEDDIERFEDDYKRV